MSVKAFNAKLEYGNASGGTSSSWTALASVKNFKPGKITAKDIDVTVLDSPNEFEVFLPGLANGGDMEATIQYDSTQGATLYGLFRTPKDWRIVYADASGWLLQGYINEYGDEEVVNGEIVMTGLKIKITAQPTPATGLS